VCVYVCTCVHVRIHVNTTDCSVGRWLFHFLLKSFVSFQGNLIKTELVFGVSPSSVIKCLFLSHMYLCFVTFGRDIRLTINIWHVPYVGLSIHSLIPLARAECDDFLLFTGASSIPLCYILYPAIVLHQLFFHPPSLHLAICFLVYLMFLLIPNSYTIRFWEFYFLPFSLHVQVI
jgi:hypothetical protein